MISALYVIGDVHGHLDKLTLAHDLIAADAGARDAEVIHVGDLVDRGPDSRGVIAHLMAGQADGRPWRVIRGNHDRFFHRFLQDRDWIDGRLASGLHWLDHDQLGAQATLESYGITVLRRQRDEIWAEAQEKVPAAHRRWLEQLPNLITHPRGVFVHAGIRPGVAFGDQQEDDLLWIRKPFLDDPRDHGALIVHGHSSVRHPTFYGNRLNVDGGAGHGRDLFPVVIDDAGMFLITPDGRVPVARG